MHIFHTMSQKHQLLIANSIIESTHNEANAKTLETKSAIADTAELRANTPS
jgi:hypothetical protein